MNVIDLVAALELPAACRIEQRVPKKLLIEKLAPVSGDKKRINEGIDSLIWYAALKPNNTGIAEYRDEARQYLEIAILTMVIRPEAKAPRLVELVHRAIPHPALLLSEQKGTLTLSLAHVRPHQAQAGKTVLDTEPLVVQLDTLKLPVEQAFRSAMALSRQPSQSLLALYQGWADTVLALQASAITGQFSTDRQPESSARRAQALAQITELERRASELRKAAGREKIMAKQIELNLDIKRTLAQIAAAQAQL